MFLQVEDRCYEKLGETLECLADCLQSREEPIRQSVRRCLVSVGRPAVPGLVRVLDSGSRDARWEAAKALGEIGDPSTAAALVQTMGHDQFAIRWLAAEALIGIGKQGLEPLLSALLLDPGSGFLRDGAHHVLRVLRDADPSLREVLSPLVGALGGFTGAEGTVRHIEAALEALRAESGESPSDDESESDEEP